MNKKVQPALFTREPNMSKGKKTQKKHVMRLHGTMDSVLALHPVAPGSILSIRKSFSRDVAEIY